MNRLRLQLETPRLMTVLKRNLIAKVPVFDTELRITLRLPERPPESYRSASVQPAAGAVIIRDVFNKAAQGNLIYSTRIRRLVSVNL